VEQLDHDILEWIAGQSGSPELAAQIGNAEVKKRDAMRTGFFVYFVTNAGAPPVEQGLRPVCPHIDAPDLQDGAGCDLFLRDGRLHYLEVYARGGFMPDPLTGYTLRPPT
jgi:hypothetical protein